MHRVPRDEAIARALSERPAGVCLICSLLGGAAGPTFVLHEGRECRVVLSRYPRYWGQAMVLVKPHLTHFSELPPAIWREATDAAHETAIRIERELLPVRCFVSCLGAARTDLPMSSPHLHLHVDPTYDLDDRPSSVFTYEHGMMDGSPAEWEALWRTLRW